MYDSTHVLHVSHGSRTELLPGPPGLGSRSHLLPLALPVGLRLPLAAAAAACPLAALAAAVSAAAPPLLAGLAPLSPPLPVTVLALGGGLVTVPGARLDGILVRRCRTVGRRWLQFRVSGNALRRRLLGGGLAGAVLVARVLAAGAAPLAGAARAVAPLPPFGPRPLPGLLPERQRPTAPQKGYRVWIIGFSRKSLNPKAVQRA